MMLALALAVSFQAAGPGIARTALTTTPTLEASRVEYQPGASDSGENHGYDTVLVPIDPGMTIDVDGVPTQWAPGIPVLISRGAPHHVENHSSRVVRFVEVRTIGDNAAGTNAVADARGATIVRSAYDKYVRATVWRIGSRGYVEWTADLDAINVSGDTATANPRTGAATDEIEFVRISRTAAR